MMNQVVIVGVVKDMEPSKGTLLVETERNFKNSQGEYDVDRLIIDVKGKLLCEQTFERVAKEDLIGIKGRIQTDWGRTSIVAEKISFLTTSGR